MRPAPRLCPRKLALLLMFFAFLAGVDLGLVVLIRFGAGWLG